VGVAVIDSGFDINHPDLKGHVQAINLNAHASSVADGYGHGTHLAGIVQQYLANTPSSILASRSPTTPVRRWSPTCCAP